MKQHPDDLEALSELRYIAVVTALLFGAAIVWAVLIWGPQ